MFETHEVFPTKANKFTQYFFPRGLWRIVDGCELSVLMEARIAYDTLGKQSTRGEWKLEMMSCPLKIAQN